MECILTPHLGLVARSHEAVLLVCWTRTKNTTFNMAAEGVYSSGGVMHNIFMLLLLLLVLVAAQGKHITQPLRLIIKLSVSGAWRLNGVAFLFPLFDLDFGVKSFPTVNS